MYLRWSLRSFTEPMAITVKKYGFQIQLDPRNAAVDEYVYMHKNWEPHIATAILAHLDEGSVFIDAGANIGYFSLLAASRIGQTGKVVAFEPIQRLVEQIETSIALNDFTTIDVRNMALGATKSELVLAIVPGNVGGSSLVKHNESGITETVSVVPLDDAIPDLDRVDVIKIDVEGYEYELLQGAQRVITTHHPVIVIEFSPNLYATRIPAHGSAILEFMRKHGYTIYDLEQHVVVDDVQSYLDTLGCTQTNLIAVAG